MEKHEIVGKDWAVVDVVTRFCQKFGLGYGQGLNIRYHEVNEEEATAFVGIISWGKGSSLMIKLRKNIELKLWEACGFLTVRGSDDDYWGHRVLGCGFTEHIANFNVTRNLGDYKFEATDGYDGQCHCHEEKDCDPSDWPTIIALALRK